LFVSRRIPATTGAYTVLIARARPAHLIRFEVIFLQQRSALQQMRAPKEAAFDF